MATPQVELLYKISNTLQASNKTYEILQSYYVTKSKKIYKVKNSQYFSQLICEKCGLQFSNDIFQSHVISANKTKPSVETQPKTRCGNCLVKVCKLCNHKTIVPLKKPPRVQKQNQNCISKILNKSVTSTNNISEYKTSSSKSHIKNNSYQNVYSNSQTVFTTRKKEHVSDNHVKKKKDKLAGLCKKAIMEAQKFKASQEAKLKAANKINLFLRTF